MSGDDRTYQKISNPATEMRVAVLDLLACLTAFDS